MTTGQGCTRLNSDTQLMLELAGLHAQIALALQQTGWTTSE